MDFLTLTPRTDGALIPGDITSDIHKLERVSFVMKNGVVIKQQP